MKRKPISSIQQKPFYAYEVANEIFGLKPGDELYNHPALAHKAALDIQCAGWKFVGYTETGQEVFAPPAWNGGVY